MEKELSTTSVNHTKMDKDYQEWIAKLASVAERLKNEPVSYNKLQQLIEKVYKRQLTIAFTGHFSAGKSTMVNHLVGLDVLPTSPIPTSANLVCFYSGERGGLLYTENDEMYQLPENVRMENIQEYCQRGDITRIDIAESTGKIANNVLYMDTPGIDSVDNAHKLSTESGLHLADIIFYVMDYNHVQSEQNFVFTKALKDQGKSVFAIINQIDKHDDSELSFSNYKQQTEAAFKNWGVEIDGFYYTSMKSENVEVQDFERLNYLISHSIENKDEIILKEASKSAQLIVRDYFQQLELDLSDYYDLPMNIEKNVHEIEKRLSEIKLEKEKYLTSLTTSKNEVMDSLTKLLNNATIVPYETRQLAENFLISMQRDFKVGLLFSATKTEKEKEHRKAILIEDIKEKAKTQLDWHMKDFLVNMLRKEDMLTQENERLLYDNAPEITDDILVSAIQPGASLNNQYILRYAADLEAKVKQLYRKFGLSIIEKYVQSLESKTDNLFNKLQIEEDDFNRKLSYIEKYKLEKQKQMEAKDDAIAIITAAMDEFEREKYYNLAENVVQHRLSKIKTLHQAELGNKHSLHKETKTTKEVEQVNELINKEVNSNITQKIKKAIDILSTLGGLESSVHSLRNKLGKLENKRFTIALFGAFSAGKSSFANALMDSERLPVSPNPTTAAINQILPISEVNPHGTVRVVFKTKEMLLADVRYSLGLLGININSIEEAIDATRKLDENKLLSKYKPHVAFLKAVQSGMGELGDKLGTELVVNQDDFREFVAEETKACFVSKIELYFDSDITRQGVSIVDTPGADSIHVRHTNVAFNYIKDADAIIFITYYNHAFSKADREFLIQLGRVKESFEMDKMFFVVNAVDLASSQEEKQQVVSYVSEQLTEYGIKQPRMFPVSSKLAMSTKQTESATGFLQFTQSFYTFLEEDLHHLVKQSALEIIRQSATTVNTWIDLSRKSEADREKELALLENSKEQLLNGILKSSYQTNQTSLSNEINELLYYVGDRLRIRFYDLFNESFNPSAFTSKEMNEKNILKECLKELLGLVEYNFVQELRATSLRIENYLKKDLQALYNNFENRITKEQQAFQLSINEIEGFETPILEDEEYRIPLDHFQSTVSNFKNTKQFFEKGGKDKMRDDVLQLMMNVLQTHIEQSMKVLNTHYQAELTKMVEIVKENTTTQIKEFYQGLYNTMSGNTDITVLTEIKNQLNELLND